MNSALHYLIAARQCEIEELEQLLRTSGLLRQLVELIHALQRERGLSNIVLASSGRRGQPALQAQVLASDRSARLLQNGLRQTDLSGLKGGHGARFFNQIAYVQQGLDALPQLREHTQALALTPEQVTEAYIRLIAGLLAVVFETADGATQPGISRLLVAMFHFMQGKELTGQERATGAQAFGSGQSHAPRQQHWLHLIDSQERCFQVFIECAPSSSLALWQRDCERNPALSAIERMRRIACTAFAGQSLDTGLSTPWFDACTARMDGMHAIELQLAGELEQRCAQQLQAALSALARPEELSSTGEASDFFAAPAPNVSLQLGAGYAPQLGQTVLSLVQEQSQRLQSMHAELETVRAALNERKTLERAKGLLMTHRHLSESEAHKLLRQTAMNQNRRLVDVAEAVLAMADLLPTSPPAKAG